MRDGADQIRRMVVVNSCNDIFSSPFAWLNFELVSDVYFIFCWGIHLRPIKNILYFEWNAWKSVGTFFPQPWFEKKTLGENFWCFVETTIFHFFSTHICSRGQKAFRCCLDQTRIICFTREPLYPMKSHAIKKLISFGQFYFASPSCRIPRMELSINSA